MLKKLYSVFQLKLQIVNTDPILVKSGMASLSDADMAFIQTKREDKPECFLPGSSLKGLLRSHMERICRTLKEDSVCVPYGRETKEPKSASCSQFFKEKKDKPSRNNTKSTITAEIYGHSCPACRLFGSAFFTGRLSTSDAYLEKKVSPEQRTSVALDRYTSKPVKGALFTYECLPAQCSFHTSLTLRNPELWMLGALGYLLWDLEDGLLRLGAHKSRGMGGIRGTLQSFQAIYYQNPKDELLGLEDFLSSEERENYQIQRFDLPRFSLKEAKKEARGVQIRYDLLPLTVEENRIKKDGLLGKLAPYFHRYLESVRWWSAIHQW
ncbi:MAG: hypothetical protein D6805_08815 [Planctomycetota bacterium]|nr:MAG: hypothetical protein D6805_08815 [Planctomycetota bacterium]